MSPLSQLVVLAVLSAAAPVTAQPGGTPGGAEPPAPEARTLETARVYSAAGTAVPVGVGIGLMVANASDTAVLAGALLTVAGGIVGPSAGHVYLGDGRRAWVGIGLRTAGVGAGVLVGALAAQRSSNSFTGGIPEFMVVGGAGFVLGGLYSFVTLDDSARERAFVVAPTLGADGRPVLAVALRL